MDYLASEIRKELHHKNVHQFISLGQGDLTVDQAFKIGKMENIDAVGINCYRDPQGKEGIEWVIQLASALIDRPIYFSEFGKPAIDSLGQEYQSEYIQQMSQVIFSNSAGRRKTGNVVGAFIHEATNEKWKQFERGIKHDGYFGILGKKSEQGISKWLSRYKDFQKVMSKNDDPTNLLSSIWNLLQGEYSKKYGSNYGECIAYSDYLIKLYQKSADSQQRLLLNTNASLNSAANDSFWALNSVGTAFFIKGRCKLEIAKSVHLEDISTNFRKEAKKDFNYVMDTYPYAHMRGAKGEYWPIKEVIRGQYPELSPQYLEDNTKGIFLFIFLPLVFITHVGKALTRNFIKNRSKRNSEVIQTIDLPYVKRLLLTLLITAQLIGLYFLIIWWYHPVRLEFYTVNPLLYWILSIAKLFGIVFYFYIWFLLYTIKRPQHRTPPTNLKVAMVTTFVKGEPVTMLESTLKKMMDVDYPHDVYLADESNDYQVLCLCKKLGVIHFSRRGIKKYNTEQGQFQRRTKGGNLNSWLDRYGQQYQIVVFLDPDHAPEPNFLVRTLAYFEDQNVGFVQAPQVLGNQSDNWIARGASEQSYFFFGPIQMGLYGIDSCMLNGSHTILRISALVAIGVFSLSQN